MNAVVPMAGAGLRGAGSWTAALTIAFINLPQVAEGHWRHLTAAELFPLRVGP